MSGIAGIWMLDGQPVTPHRLGPMLDAMAHRGPDGARAWVDGPVGLGHCMLQTTPESVAEVLPLREPTGSCVLTSDARIDNRDELIRRLGLARAESIADSEIILAAYLHWGEDCPQHFLGDFAFAIWDARQRRIFCARDHFGVRPFHYHHRPGRLFAFASEAKGVIALPEVPREISEWWVARFLTLQEDDLASTVYEQVFHLPPAHTLTVTSERAVLRRYWSLDPEMKVRRRSSREYEEEFRDIFFEAVRCRLRSTTPVGSALSGGLDSSSIACTAREVLKQEQRGPLHTFSLVFDETPESDERPYINAVLERGGVVPHFVRMSELKPIEEAARFAPYLDGPMSTANLAINFGILSAARQAGSRVVLDGFFGDDSISHGLENFAEMMRARQYLRAAVTGYQYARNFRQPLGWVYKRLVVGPVAPAPLSGLWKKLRPRTTAQNRRPITGLYNSLVNSDLLQRTTDISRDVHPVMDPTRPPARRAHYGAFVNPFVTIALETDDLVGAAYGAEMRFPFLDRRVVEFAYGLPSEQKLHGGWSRSILRRALSDVVPAKISWRTDKGDLSYWLTNAVSGAERVRLRGIVNENAQILHPYVDVANVRVILEEAIQRRCAVRFVAVWHSLALGLWLNRQESGSTDHSIRKGEGILPVASIFSPSAFRQVEKLETSCC